MPVTINCPADQPSQVFINFSTYAEFEITRSDDEAYALYLRALYSHMVGRIMPIQCTAQIPVNQRQMTPAALAAAKALGAKKGQLVMRITCSHKELDGYPLTYDMLPVIATHQGEVPRLVARALANEHRSTGTTDTDKLSKEN